MESTPELFARELAALVKGVRSRADTPPLTLRAGDVDFKAQIMTALEGSGVSSVEYGSDPCSLPDMVRRIREEGDRGEVPIARFAPGERLKGLVDFDGFKAVYEEILQEPYEADRAAFPITYERLARFFGAPLVHGRHSSLPGPSPLRRQSKELFGSLDQSETMFHETVAKGSIPRDVGFPRSLDQVPRTLEGLRLVLQELLDGVPTILHPDVLKFLFGDASSGDAVAGRLALDSRVEAPEECRSESGYAFLSNGMYHRSTVLFLDWDFSGKTVLAAQLRYEHDVLSLGSAPVWVPLVKMPDSLPLGIRPSLTPDHRLYVRGNRDEVLAALPEGRCTQIIEIPGESQIIHVDSTRLPPGATRGHWAWEYVIEQ